MGFVYGIRATDSAEYFYIGSTKKSLQARLTEHLAQVRTGVHINRHFANKVRKVGLSNVVIEVIEECSDADRFALEYAHIKAFQKHGAKLTNISDGTEIWRKTSGQYSLRENWEWAQQWYAHYMETRGADEGDATEDAVCSVLAEVIASILAAPPEKRASLIDFYS